MWSIFFRNSFTIGQFPNNIKKGFYFIYIILYSLKILFKLCSLANLFHKLTP